VAEENARVQRLRDLYKEPNFVPEMVNPFNKPYLKGTDQLDVLPADMDNYTDEQRGNINALMRGLEAAVEKASKDTI